MKQKIMEEIMQQMLLHLNNAQLQKLQEVMEHSFYNYEISGKTKELEDDSQKLIDAFVYAKRNHTRKHTALFDTGRSSCCQTIAGTFFLCFGRIPVSA